MKYPFSLVVAFIAISYASWTPCCNRAFSALALASSSTSPRSSLLPESDVSPLSSSTLTTPTAAFVNNIDDAVTSIDAVSLQQQQRKQQIRASKYGIANNSTILSPADAAASVGVRPTLENATKGKWQRAWKLHRFMMKVLLHRFDSCRPGDSKLALACLWWKALSGNDITSPVYDRELSYDLLPPVTRWIVSPRICRWYPRLHHANVEIRTAYLDRSVIGIIDSKLNTDETQINGRSKQKSLIRMIIMGGGYDTRGVKLFERSLLHARVTDFSPQLQRRLLKLNDRHRSQSQQRELCERRRGNHRRRPWKNSSQEYECGQVQGLNIFSENTDQSSLEHYDLECYELDLPEVVEAKSRLLQKRLFRRRPWLGNASMGLGPNKYPKLLPANFNNVTETRKVLESILLSSSSTPNVYDNITNIIVFEGVMIYLDEGIPHALLKLTSEMLEAAQTKSLTPSEGYLCFADRLENVPSGDTEAARSEMESTGWELIDWLPKPGLARHMGIARLKRDLGI